MADLSLFRRPLSAAAPTLETVLTSPEWFGLATASPLQLAICRIADGLLLDELATDATVVEALGGAAAVEALPRCRCAALLILAGIRSGKSLIAAAIAVRAALSCDLSKLGAGEEPRVSVLSLTVDTAMATWAHIRGRIEASPALRPLLLGAPKASSLRLRHPSGRAVEICVVAGRKAAGSLVARWSAGVVFDEAPRMNGQDEGVVNLDNARLAVAGRLLPGAQVVMVGSPWAPFGPVYDLVDKHHGKPSTSMVVVRASGPAMNPREWTPERCAELKARDPDAFRVDVMTEFLDPESSLLALGDLEACRRAAPLDLSAAVGCYYCAAIDPATRGNAWTLVVLERSRDGRLRVALARQWVGSTSEPLSPKATLGEIATLLATYAVRTLHTDQWAADALQEIASDAGLWLVASNVTGPLRLELYTELRARFADRTIELPPLLAMLRDLQNVRKRVTAAGVTITLPRTGDGRHCDYAPALALAVAHPPRAPDAPEPPAVGTPERATLDAEAAREAARREVESRLKLASKRWQQAMRLPRARP